MGWRDWIPRQRASALPVARVDAEVPLGEYVGDQLERFDASSVINQLTGLGGFDDKGSAARPNVMRARLTDVELASLYLNNGLMQRVANIVPKEMTRKGWTITDDTDDPDALAGEERRLMINTRIREVTTWARVFGGAVILMVTDEGPDVDLQEPLDLNNVRKLQALQVFDAWEATPFTFDGSIESPNYRDPLLWALHPVVVGINGQRVQRLVHASRILYFPGVKRPPSLRFGGFQGSTSVGRGNALDDSVYQAIWDEARNLSQINAAGAVLAQEIRENVLKIGGLAAMLTGDQKEQVEGRITLIAKMKALLGIVLLSQEDEYTSKVNSPSGFRELSAPAMAMVSAVTGIALSILFGFAPTGLSTDDKSGRQSFDRLVSGEQEGIRPQLETIYTVLFLSKEGPTKGKIPKDWSLAFLPLDEESEKEIADKRKVVAETDAIYIDAGVLSPGTVREGRFGGKGYQFELLPEDEVDDDVEDIDDPDEAQAALDALRRRRDVDPRQVRSALNTDDAVWLAVFPSTDAALARVAEFRASAETALGVELLDPPPPHVTLLFVGPVDDAEMAAMLIEVRDALALVTGPIALHPREIQAFEVGANGRSAVVLRLDDFELEALHARLLRALAPRVTAPQFADFKAHLTLGSVEGEADQVALAEMERGGDRRFEPIAMVGQVVVLRGGERVAEIPLATRVDGGGDRVAK